MITCPWCGTSYKAFQSSCGKCGGPLAAEQGQDGRPPSSLATPPPAPRAFHEEYARHLVKEDPEAANGMAVAFIGGFLAVNMVLLPVVIGVQKLDLAGALEAFGLYAVAMLLFALLLFAFALYLLIGGISIVRQRDKELQKMVDVMRVGQATVGEIVEVRENRKQSHGERHPWEIYYRYKVNGGQRMHGKMVTTNTPGARHQPGCEVNVLYLPDEPAQSVLYPHP